MHKLNGKTPATKMTGDTPDISFLAEFGWFDFIWYFPSPGLSKKRGHYLGPSMTVGSAMCGTVITEKATHLDQTSIMPLTREDLNDPVVQAKMVEFMTELTTKLDARMARQGEHRDVDAPSYVDPNDVHDEFQVAPYTENYEPWTPEELGFDPDSVEHKPQWGDLPEADDTKAEADKVDFDENKYIAAKVMIPKDGFDFAVGKVIGRVRDESGELVCKSNRNPLLDTAVYDVEMSDGSVEKYSANIIAEHIYSQLDEGGRNVTLLSEIVDHKKSSAAVAITDGWDPAPGGSMKPKKTTIGWQLLAQFKDGSKQWISLKDFKESNPVEVVDYAVAHQLVCWDLEFSVMSGGSILPPI